jgi:hypothetical protein
MISWLSNRDVERILWDMFDYRRHHVIPELEHHKLMPLSLE